MVIVSIIGGLGNQFSAYACGYIVAKELKQPLILDISDYTAGYFRPFALEWCSIPNHLKLFFPKIGPIYSSIGGAPEKVWQVCDGIINTDNLDYDRNRLLEAAKGHRNVYIQGYGGLDFCTEQEKQELIALFQPSIQKGTVLKKFCEKTEYQESVAVHIRRTDFVELNWVGEDEDIKYYKAAIQYMRQELEQPQFYLFSDDIEWVKAHLGNAYDFHYINIVGGTGADVEELYCISLCKHRILTKQSSYGWWAAKLSPHKAGMNIIRKDDVLKGIENRVTLTDEETDQLSQLYTTQFPVKKNMDQVLQSLEKEIIEGRNEKVIEGINTLGLDSWDFTDQVKRKLLEYKGIAYLQMQGGEWKALSVFDKLQQTDRDNYDFSFNYAIALAKTGRRLESILYAGNAVRISGKDDIVRILDINGDVEQEVFDLVFGQRKRHYIFADSIGHNNVRDYYHSLGIVLRNLGNRVTFLELEAERIMVKHNSVTEIKAMVEGMLSSPREECVYQYDIKRYVLRVLEAEGKLYSAVPYAVECLKDEREETVLVAHNLEEIKFTYNAEKYPIIYIDVFSEWNVDKFSQKYMAESDWETICQMATKFLTNREVHENYSGKREMPFHESCRQEGDDIFYEKNRILFTDHYMRNEELLWGVLSLIKTVDNLLEDTEAVQEENHIKLK